MTRPNPELQLAADYALETDTNLFLTGKAGTGKTTFLHQFRRNTPKRLIVTAPTGVAAINAGGVTLHSFFQMPLGPLVPGTESFERANTSKFNKEKKQIILSLDMLVIDEISMVRADLLDGVDKVLRRIRRNDRSFGGVQLLMIGDLNQLPPVVPEDQQALIRSHYESPYFFSSHALRQSDFVSIELQHIYRQSDQRFINLLNRIRNNKVDDSLLQELNSRYLPGSGSGIPQEGTITLSSHNRNADTINASRLAALSSRSQTFTADVEGEFPEYAFPTAARLELKTGAQVMFVRNDTSGDRLYYNGKIGKVMRVDNDSVTVRCQGDDHDIHLERVSWDNIKYRLDPESSEIKEEKTGSFTQFPLKLAWAITIHKSQGLTFEKALIDAQDAFAHGQVYVALSRCKTFEGLTLSTPIARGAIRTDPAVQRFNDALTTPAPEQLQLARRAFQQRLLLECFQLQRLRFCLNRLVSTLTQNKHLIHISFQDDLHQLQQKASQELFVVSDNFQRQLTGLFPQCGLPDSDPTLRERAVKAAAYFQQKLGEHLDTLAASLSFETDNKELKKRLRQEHDEFRRELLIKQEVVRSCEDGFSPATYLRALSAAEVRSLPVSRDSKSTAEYTTADIAHPELYEMLKQWRDRKADDEGVERYRILHQSILIQVAVMLPDTLGALRKIKGIGSKTAQKYGDELTSIVSDYRKNHKITEVTPPEPTPIEPAQKNKESEVSPTKQTSYDLFRQGLTIAQIAEQRGLVSSTIEGHLTTFIARGELAIDEVVPEPRLNIILQAFETTGDKPFSEIKNDLGEDYSYGEIKMVHVHLKLLENESKL